MNKGACNAVVFTLVGGLTIFGVEEVVTLDHEKKPHTEQQDPGPRPSRTNFTVVASGDPFISDKPIYEIFVTTPDTTYRFTLPNS